MRIDIDALTGAELIDLNNRIVERLRFLSQMRAHGQMLQFKIGDRVSFRWNVAPTLLRSADSSAVAQNPGPNVIQLRKTGFTLGCRTPQ